MGPTSLAPHRVLLFVGAVCAASFAAAAGGAPSSHDCGHEVRVTDITLAGNKRTRDQVIRRELRCKVGDPRCQVDCRAISSRLYNTELFSQVEVVADSLTQPGALILRIAVKERPYLLPYPIFNKSTKSGFSYGAGVSLHNLRGNREELGISGSAGGVRGVSVGYLNPWLTGNRLSLNVSTSFRLEDNRFEDFVEETVGASVALGTAWTSDNTWRSRIAFNYLSLISNQEGKTIDLDNHDILLSLGAGVTYDTRDIWKNPTRGSRYDYVVRFYGGALGGNVEYAHHQLAVRHFVPTPIGRTLGLYLRGVRRAGNVPPYRRLHLGSGSTVRGYATSSRAGSHTLLAGVEYRLDLMQPRIYHVGEVRNLDFALGMAFFVDAGAAWTDDARLRWNSVISSYGIGLRGLAHWIDVARADLAMTAAGELRVEFGGGMKF